MSVEFVKCPTCGDEVATRYRPITCYKCGVIAPHLIPPLPPPDPAEIAAISSHIILTTVSLLFCFLPALGGVIYSLLVIGDKKRGDFLAAEKHSRFAKQCAIAAYVLGILAFLIKLNNSMR